MNNCWTKRTCWFLTGYQRLLENKLLIFWGKYYISYIPDLLWNQTRGSGEARLSCFLYSAPLLSVLIVSGTKFLIVIGSWCAYLSLNHCMITLVSNYKYPIWTSYNWIFVIGYLHVTFCFMLQLSRWHIAMFVTEQNSWWGYSWLGKQRVWAKMRNYILCMAPSSSKLE